MPLVNCPDCARAFSDSAAMCPHCGLPMTPATLKKAAELREEINKPGCLVIGGGILLAFFIILLLYMAITNPVGIR